MDIQVSKLNKGFIHIFKIYDVFLIQIDNLKYSVDELDCVLKSTKLITNTIFQVKQVAASADSVYSYLSLQTQFQIFNKIVEQYHFYRTGVNKSKMISYSSYCTIQLSSGMIWIGNANCEK